MNRNGLLHFDAHFRNILTDGHRLYFADLGLATSVYFELSEAESRFVASNALHDRCYVTAELLKWLVANLTDVTGWPARFELIRQCAEGTSPAGLPGWAVATIRRHAPTAVLMNDFYWAAVPRKPHPPLPQRCDRPRDRHPPLTGADLIATRLPAKVRLTAENRGQDGSPRYLAHLQQAWSLQWGEVLDGGPAALVVRVTRHDAADGNGYVRLFDYDLDRETALMEPLGRALSVTAPPVREALGILAATLKQAWQVPVPAGSTVAPGADKASQLSSLITALWTELGRQPCSQRLISTALSYADSRSRAFSLAESGYVFVDPDGLLAEPAYDLGVAVRGWTAELLSADDPAGLLRSYGYCQPKQVLNGCPRAFT